jgi:hypothetical protein
MPYDEPDPDDPTVIVGVNLPGDSGSTRELVYALAEEFASLGYGEDWIMHMFGTPFFAGAHRAFLELGEKESRAIVQECVGLWGRVRFVDRVPVSSPGMSGSGGRPPAPLGAPVTFRSAAEAPEEI